MKRCWFSVIALVAVLLSGSISLHAQKIYTNAQPEAFGHNMKTYYLVQKTNLGRILDAVPEDKFFALPPGCTPETCKGEQSSIGAEVAHAADAQYRMCTLVTTGMSPRGSTLPGTIVMKSGMPTKAAVLDALAKSFASCDPIIDNWSDANVAALVRSQHALKPLGSTVFNTISHDREVYGRIRSYMAQEGIKAPEEINSADPDNRDDNYYCGGTTSKTIDNCK